MPGAVPGLVGMLLHLKSLAKKQPDGFSSEPRIIRNPLPGVGNTIPRKPTTPTQPLRN
jgi:hypothetical protein